MGYYYDNLINIHSLSKTLCFQLKPVGETQSNIDKNGIVVKDQQIYEKYFEAKSIFDRFHRNHIEYILSKDNAQKLGIDWRELYRNYIQYKADKKSKEWLNGSREARAKISNSLADGGSISTKEIVKEAKEKGAYLGYPFEGQEKEVLKAFEGFDGYFSHYNESRKNIYKKQGHGSVSRRAIDDNFSRYADNIVLFNKLPETIKKEIEKAPVFGNSDISSAVVFDPAKYFSFLSQNGIDTYNLILGGKTTDEKTKIKGINEILNEQYQKGELKEKKVFKILYKQILNDKSSFSYTGASYESDADILAAVKSYSESLQDHINKTSQIFLDALRNEKETDSIFILDRHLNSLSNCLYGRFDKIRKSLDSSKKEYYSIKEISECLEDDTCILTRFADKLEEKDQEIFKTFEQLGDQLKSERITSWIEIKTHLDSIQETERLLKTLTTVSKTREGETNEDCPDKDAYFYEIFENYYSVFEANITIYNAVRNYATKKPYKTEKIKLNFENGQLANGWDKNKEPDSRTIILRRDDLYYVGIYGKKCSKDDFLLEMPTESGSLEKMVYKQIPNAAKYLSIKQIRPQNPPVDIVRYLEKNSKNLTRSELNKLIGYVTNEFIPNYDKIKNKTTGECYFDFKFKKASEYENWTEFCLDVDRQAYALRWLHIDPKQVDRLVKEGKLYLFELYNSDMSDKAHGKEKLFTMYFKNLFTEENLKHPNYRLSGGAELFYQAKSNVDNPFIHKKGSILFNKKKTDGSIIGDEEIKSLYAEINSGTDIESLRTKHPDVVFKMANYDIIKNRRYLQDHYEIHLPISFNNLSDNAINIDKYVAEKLLKDPSINIIGIDRGERNLLYMTVIDQKGNLLEQRSLNTVNGFDYHKKLGLIESERDFARKNWGEISKISDLKKGYLSVVINEIIQSMLKYNAVVVLEALNSGFKRVRSGITEKSIYQQFEVALVKKLNYVGLKDRGAKGGYQLAKMPKNISDLDKKNQVGALFYVPAAYTSKIDPRTGFSNLFTSEYTKYRSKEKSADFFSRFERISYNENLDCFEFEFKYSKFPAIKTKDYTDHWTICTVGKERIVHIKDGNYDRSEFVDVTERIKMLFANHNIPLNGDLKKAILSVDDADFFKTLIWLFKTVVALRYEDKENDFILSPIVTNGKWFDSRHAEDGEPIDGDANGAYHIALQGLRMISRIDPESLSVENDKKGESRHNYLEFCLEKKWKIQ